jgi:hypothetical protein
LRLRVTASRLLLYASPWTIASFEVDLVDPEDLEDRDVDAAARDGTFLRDGLVGFSAAGGTTRSRACPRALRPFALRSAMNGGGVLLRLNKY